MTYSPATPAKDGGINLHESSSLTTSERKYASTSGGSDTRSLLHDPSPASTYGESNTDESVPGTPIDGLRSARRLAKSLTTISESNGTDQQYPMKRDGNHGMKLQDDSFLALIENLGISRASSSSAPSVVNTPSKTQFSHSAGFVVQSRDGAIEDPFTTSPYHKDSPSPRGQVTPTRIPHSANATPTRIKSSARGLTTPNLANQAANNDTASHTFSPREDRLVDTPSVDNAQAIFPPDACVFVANLSQGHSDEQLESAVSHVFHRFGTVYTKIRRDSKGMPYAFCQYETKKEADRAIVEGKGKIICGRKCRTESAKVQRALYVSKHDGQVVDEQEALNALSDFGAIESVFYPTETERELYHLPPGLWVRFAFFQDCRDAYTQLRDHPEFRFDQYQEPVRGRNSVNRARPSPPCRPVMPASASGPGYFPGIDLNPSIFVGNLPSSVTQNGLIAVFGKYGTIIGMQVVTRSTQNNTSTTTYATIDFLNPHAARMAVSTENGRLVINGNKIRVERKDQRPSQPSWNPNEPLPSVLNNRFAQQHLQPFLNFQEALAQVYPQAVGYPMHHADMVAATARTLAGNPPNYLPNPNLYPGNLQYGYYHNSYPQVSNGNASVNTCNLQASSSRAVGPIAGQSSNSQSPGTYSSPTVFHRSSPSITPSSATSRLTSPAPSSTASHQSGVPLNYTATGYLEYTNQPGSYGYTPQYEAGYPYSTQQVPSVPNSSEQGMQD